MRTLSKVSTARPWYKRGFTLVELMIGLALGMLLLLGVISIFSGSKQSYRYNEAMARMQENGRFATALLERELRMANYGGCKKLPLQVEGLQGAPRTLLGTLYDDYIDSIIAKKYTQSGREGVSVLRGGEGIVLEADYQGGTSMQLSGADRYFVVDQIGMVTNCEQIGFFKVTGVSPTGITLDQPITDVNGGEPAFNAYLSTVLTMPVWTHYYVADSERNEGGETRQIKSLYRQVGSGTAQELVEGVESMYVQYGLRRNTPAFEKMVAPYDPVENYVDSMPDNDPQWSDVGALRIQLLMRSPEEYVVDKGVSRTLAFGPTGEHAIDASDRKLYEVFTTTIALRNRVR